MAQALSLCVCVRLFSGDTDVLSRSSEGKSVSPSDAPETTFTRKVGAFVNKPTTQVRTQLHK